MKRAFLFRWLTCLVAAPLLAGLLNGQTPPLSELELSKRAGFIFEGQAEKAGPEQLKGVELPSRGVIVKVLQVYYVSPNVAVRAGDFVVVQLVSAEARPGRAVFYTNGWGYGSYLLVRELGHLEPTKSSSQMKEEIASAKAAAEDDRIRERLANSALVVSGRVAGTRPYENPKEGSKLSEHNPEWWIAEVKVEKVLKGKSEKAEVLVAFPSSRDVMWAESPKFKEGQEGLWILARLPNLQREFANLPQPVYTAISKRDFRAVNEMEHITKLLQTPSKNQ